MNRTIRWGRVLLAAVLLEVAISLFVAPFGMFFGNPLFPRPDAQPSDFRPYLISAGVGCAVLGFLFGLWVARKVAAQRALHGLLVGLVATLLYIALGMTAPGGVGGIIAAYGPMNYVLFNALRIGGCLAGGLYQERR